MQGKWCDLKHLSLGVGRSAMSVQHLAGCPWNALEELRLHSCNITLAGAFNMTQARLPCSKLLAFLDVSLSDGEE